MDDYFDVVVETYWNKGEPSSKDVRVRPVTGQGLDTDLNVRCSSAIRNPLTYRVGTKFIIKCKLADRQGGPPFLHSPYTWPYRMVSDEEANDFINTRNKQNRLHGG